ncbi:hypothetical protein SAMN02745157_0196 [Kaistia soli DSM 19436]|uniref:Uncharacterized protein n=1 Tax=Kaistia soli DSM 19436 TaxID=1122133 RepID=A0A1M5PNW0_9HYPH|nr:hypothetical protein [Kaistia soli]SHH03400.1 hypothetical protein SAMN02745157_0196 [Kaistia soli DSM 19436]
MREHFIADEIYWKLIAELQKLAGKVERDLIIETLGDHGIWPRKVLDDSFRLARRPASGVSLARSNYAARDENGRQ